MRFTPKPAFILAAAALASSFWPYAPSRHGITGPEPEPFGGDPEPVDDTPDVDPADFDEQGDAIPAKWPEIDPRRHVVIDSMSAPEYPGPVSMGSKQLPEGYGWTKTSGASGWDSFCRVMDLRSNYAADQLFKRRKLV